mmetsp:Transcript_33100/g.68930  ORF Transcript_33100/g.68930 Transcript_33100/m.68930 type:complete len:316 (-) Transcript_33100:452-1399(-)|eukprot:CAMPEP_0172439776 /NCGR_PEP_ID=MMETSP1065-20121228/645_1 /TAXON_ID=265537 /ORGANISM="Amphiprora paludosa, Strain CCMP125" /LENGTH=315 /DNA_ID=CAMNT_0013188501 /DNA_START=53 /DNA_END=1000 /DNA_ORIENTATION=-
MTKVNARPAKRSVPALARCISFCFLLGLATVAYITVPFPKQSQSTYSDPTDQPGVQEPPQGLLRGLQNLMPYREPRLADGCSCVFLDVGANRGIQTRKLFEPELFPRAGWPKQFQKYFGSDIEAIRRDCCSIGVEPNPMHKAELQRLKASYASKGWRVEFLHKAAWTNDHGNLTYLHEFTEERTDHKELSSRLVHHKPGPGAYTEVVGSVDMARFIQHHVLERVWDDKTKNGTIVMKMDTEGAEFQIFPHLLTRGVLCELDFLASEFHFRHAPGNRTEWQQKKNVLYDLLASTCKVDVSDFDDEIYYDSNFTLPA